MSQSTTGPDHEAGGPPGATPATVPPARRSGRPPLWLLILVGVLIVAAIVTAIALSQNGGAEPEPTQAAQEPPPDVVVTLPVPTPTIEPVPREPGTAFFQALPSTVLAYALTAAGPDPGLVATGALEGYTLTYSDGGSTQLVVLAGQWATPEGANAALDAVIARETPNGTPEQGAVTVDGTDVGRYFMLTRPDGTGSVWWTNQSVLLQVDGPPEALSDVFTAFPL
jgi:hypothetical protein